jgi:hypothetical protein
MKLLNASRSEKPAVLIFCLYLYVLTSKYQLCPYV